MNRGIDWFKNGFQYDIKCDAVSAKGLKAKPAITVFAEDRADAIDIAIKELTRYGYSNVTIDKLTKYAR